MLFFRTLLFLFVNLTLVELTKNDIEWIKNELTNLQHQLSNSYRKTLENVDKIVTEKLTEKRKTNEHKAVDCVTKFGQKLVKETEEKAREATIGFIESCRNIKNLIENDDMNQGELEQTMMMLQQGGLFKSQITQTVKSVSSYISKKIWEFQQKSEICY